MPDIVDELWSSSPKPEGSSSDDIVTQLWGSEEKSAKQDEDLLFRKAAARARRDNLLVGPHGIYPGLKPEEALKKFHAESGPASDIAEQRQAASLAAGQAVGPAAAGLYGFGVGTGVGGPILGVLTGLGSALATAYGQKKITEAAHPGATKESEQIAGEFPKTSTTADIATSIAVGGMKPGLPRGLAQAGVGSILGMLGPTTGAIAQGRMPTIGEEASGGLVGLLTRPRTNVFSGTRSIEVPVEPQKPVQAQAGTVPVTPEVPLKTPSGQVPLTGEYGKRAVALYQQYEGIAKSKSAKAETQRAQIMNSLAELEEGQLKDAHATAVRQAVAHGEQVSPESLAMVPEAQNAAEVISKLPSREEQLAVLQTKMEEEFGQPPASGENIYLKMPLDRIKTDADKGIALAQVALKIKQAGGVGKPPQEPPSKPPSGGGGGAEKPPGGGFEKAQPGYAEAREGYEPGHQTWDQVRNTVEAVGGDIGALKEGGLTPERALAHAYKATEAMESVERLGLAIKDDPSERNVAAYVTAHELLAEALHPLRGAVTETARALAILKPIKEGTAKAEATVTLGQALKDAPPKERARLAVAIAENIGRLKDPAEVAAVLGGRYPRSLTRGQKIGAGLWEYMRNAMLSAPTTQAKKFSADVVMSVVEPLETLGTAALGAAKRAVGIQAPSRAYLGEVPAQIAGMISSVPDALRTAVGRWRLEPSTNVFAEDAHGLPVIPGMAGKAIRTPQRALGFIADLFGQMQYVGKRNALALRQALSEKKTGVDLTDRVNQIIANPESIRGPQGTIGAQARAIALENTFMNPNSIGRWIGRAKAKTTISGFPVLGPLIPFQTVNLNVKAAALRRSPLAPLLPSVRDAIKLGGEPTDRAFVRMGIGTAIATYLGYLAKKGLITGDAPETTSVESKELPAKRAAGWQPNSIRIGNTWVDAHSLPITGDIATTVANFVNAQEHISEEGQLHVAANLALAIGKQAASVSFLDDIRGLADAAAGDPNAVKHFRDSVLTMPIPNLLSKAGLAMDPNYHRTVTLMDAAKAKVPGLRETLPTYRDLYGLPSKAGGSAVSRFLLPIKTSEISTDPVRSQLADLKMRLSYPSQVIYGYRMTPQEYENYSEKVGKIAYDLTSGLIVHDATWANTPKKQKQKLIGKMFQEAHQEVRNAWAYDHQDIVAAWHERQLQEQE